MDTIKDPHDIASRVSAASLACERPREIDRAENALPQKETVTQPGDVNIRSDNIALVVDSVCLSVRSTRIIDGSEHSVFVEEEAISAKKPWVRSSASGDATRCRRMKP